MSGTEPTIRSERKLREIISLLQVENEGISMRLRDGEKRLSPIASDSVNDRGRINHYTGNRIIFCNFAVEN